MMPVGDTAAHLRKQVGGLFFYTPEVRRWRCFIEKMFSPLLCRIVKRVAALHESGIGPNSDLELV
jgi:hypothetical protein